MRSGTLAVLAVLAAGCSGAGHREDGPLAVMAAQESAWNRGDIEGFMDGYSRSGGLTFSSDRGTSRGWQAVLDGYRERYPDRAAMGKLSFEDLEFRRLGPDAALVLGTWKLARAADAPGGVFTVVFVREAGGWKIVHDHTSAFRQPAP